MDLRSELHKRAWYWRGNELRECIVMELTGIASKTIVLDAETMKPADVKPEDVMIEKPERALE